MTMLRFCYATLRMAFNRFVSLLAYRPDVTKVLTPVSQPATAGELTTLGRPHALLRSLIPALLLVACCLACSSAPALAAESGACPNEALRTELNSSLLPECRAYEMVTPPYKDGYPLVLRSFASNGDQVILASFGGFAELPGSGEGLEGNFYLDTRSTDGWRPSSMMAPLSEFIGQGTWGGASEANDGMSLWAEHTPQQSVRTDELYVRSASGEYTRVGTLSPTAEESTSSNIGNLRDTPIAATSTYRHIVLSAEFPGQDYWNFDKTTGGHSLYEYSGIDNKRPVLVAVKSAKLERGEDEELVAVCGAELGSGGGGSVYNALSSDGETIFFTLSSCNPAPKTNEIYARLHGGMISPALAETVDVSERECAGAECETESGKNFEGASENGEKAFFSSTQKLTSNASNLTPGGSATGGSGCAATVSTSGCNLYEYNFALKMGRRLTLVAGGSDNVRGVAGIAEDGARIYYVAEGEVPGARENEFQRLPVAGEPNLYVYDTDTGVTSFITTLSKDDDEADWIRRFRRPVEVTGEGGRFLLFVSAASGVTLNESSKTGVAQLFEYDAETGELVRVTQGELVPGQHGEGGWNEDGNGVMVGINPEAIELEANTLGEQSDFKATTNRLNIAQNGKTVVFETAGELSPLAQPASTSAPACSSVYEFRSEGPISTGTVRLLSDGRDVPIHKNEVCGAEFIGMDENGNNILFSTSDSLLTSDVDGGQPDIYDARVNGGFPSVPAPGCEGTGCQTVLNPPPALGSSSGSATVIGNSNLTPPPATAVTPKKTTVKCAKGKKLSHGKCVKSKAKKKAKKANNGRRAK